MSPVTVLASEHTRRVAHELDDLHRHWIVNKQKDELAHLTPSPFEIPLNHQEWLETWSDSDDRYIQLVERRQYLEHKLGEMRRTRKVDGMARHKGQFFSHYEVTRLEYFYITTLQSRLKASGQSVAKGTRSTKDASGGEARGRYANMPLVDIAAAVRAGGEASTALRSLAELQGALSSWLGNANLYSSIPADLQVAIDNARDVIRSYAVNREPAPTFNGEKVPA